MARAVRPGPGKTTYRRPPKSKSKIPMLDIPFSAPFGSYDPSLDAAERATYRGLADLMADIGRGNERDRNDYTTSVGDVDRDRDETLADLQTRLARANQDIGKNRARTSEDYQRGVTGLERQYGQLANRQSQQARQSGNTTGGVLAQAMAKRAANQAIDRQPMDTNFARANQDFDVQQARVTDDVGLNTRRVTDAAGRRKGQLGLQLQRVEQDRNLVQAPRAQREANEFALDTQQSRIAQVKQTTPSYFQDWLKRRKKAGLSNTRYR